MTRTAVINVVGLTESLLGPATPRLNRFLAKGKKAVVIPVFPALTCPAQSTYLTGLPPSGHGIVANGWYDRELAEVQFWKQSDHLVQGRKVWEDLRAQDPKFTCAKLFWWYNMYSTADYAITPRPIYPADGRKVFDIYTNPFSIRTAIKNDLGDFPFAAFWGPAAGVPSPRGPPEAASRWIAESAKWIENQYHPTLSLIYLPHLDYNLQRLGPSHPSVPADLKLIDEIAGDLIDFFHRQDVRVLVLSEYGITEVDTPVHLNRLFREKGWIAIKDELGLELMDCGASKVFSVADHQVAHVYLNDPSLEPAVRQIMEKQPGIARVLGSGELAALGVSHRRSGNLIAVASEKAWFTYYYWLEDRLAPDFARCVDIHRKPGYDPVELFLDPKLNLPKIQIAWRLLKKKLGFRMLMDVIPLNATLVKGSHGILPSDARNYPLIIAEEASLLPDAMLPSTAVCQIIQGQVMSRE